MSSIAIVHYHQHCFKIHMDPKIIECTVVLWNLSRNYRKNDFSIVLLAMIVVNEDIKTASSKTLRDKLQEGCALKMCCMQRSTSSEPGLVLRCATLVARRMLCFDDYMCMSLQQGWERNCETCCNSAFTLLILTCIRDNKFCHIVSFVV